MKNAYDVGIGGFIVVSLYVVILAFFWRALAMKLTTNSHPIANKIGAAMGSTL